jgi:cytochrome c oxidase subunit III
MKLESQQISVDVTGWYWHFMGVLWFGIFALLHFARG